MRKKKTHGSKSPNTYQIEPKDKQLKRRRTQLKTIFRYLQEHTATASMVESATGVKQKNICRYKKDLEEQGLLYEVEKKLCKVTGFRAWYLTTNPDLFPEVEPVKTGSNE